jgi:hypothetical protein
MKHLKKLAASLAVVGSIIAYLTLIEMKQDSGKSLFLAEKQSANESERDYAQYVSRYSKNYKDKKEY